jgi:hypothetical protein
MKKPDELANPDNLPADLKQLLQTFKVPGNDPLVAVLAWHWLRIEETRDIIDEKRAAFDESVGKISAILNVRKEQFESWSKTLQELFLHLQDINKALSDKPLAISKAIAEQLAHPIGQSVTLVEQLATDSQQLVTTVDASQKRLGRSHLITAFLSGYATAALIISWIFFHSALH